MQGLGLAGGMAALSAGSGTALAAERTTVVVWPERVSLPSLSADAGVVEELKATARESQRPVVDFVEETEGLTLRSRLWVANAMVVSVDTSTVDPETLRSHDGVRAMHANYQLSIPEPEPTDDRSDAADTTYGLDQVDAPQAWEQFDTRGEGARVAVLDTGVDPDHPVFDIDSEDFAEFDEDGNRVEGAEVRDSDDHGTHVAGTAVGGADDSGTAIGVAPDATQLHALVLPGGSGTFAQIVGGIQWAVDNDADVINMSLGATGYFAELIEPIRNAQRAGTTVVCSAGNSGEGSSGTPANVFEAFAVGATDDTRAVAEFSSGEVVDTSRDWGVNAPDDWPATYVMPDVAGPGVGVRSALPGGEFGDKSGTSMAAPHVAGVVGLMTAAAPEPYTPAELKQAVSATAYRPDEEPDGPNTRYGAGIVDALEATGRVAADSGVTGAVTGPDGTAVEDATVTLDGVDTETGADGDYRLRALAGDYEVTADAFGFTPTSTTATVSEGSFTTVDFELSETTAVDLASGQPDGVEAGEAVEVVVRLANVESLTVELGGDYDGGADLFVDGDPARLGEPVTFDPPRSGEVTVRVETGDMGAGDLELTHTFEGAGETVQVTTGPTLVFARELPVGVVDVESGGFSSDVVAAVDQAVSAQYTLEVIDPETALSAARDGDYEALVVQNLGDDGDLVAEFLDVVAADPTVGTVFLDQFGDPSDAVSQLSAATGDPREVFDAAFELAAPDVEYAARQDHPILDGIVEAGESVTVTRPDPVAVTFGLFFGGFHTYYEDYRGEVAGTTLADAAVGFDGVTGPALGVDDLARTVVGASLGVSPFVDRNDFTADGRAVLGSAVEHVSRAPAVDPVEVPADRISPGESTAFVGEVEELVEVEVDVTQLRFVERSDLQLTVNGEAVAFGETVTFDEPFTGEIELRVRSETDGIGQFALDTRFLTVGRRDREVETAVTFPSTTVYESPIDVPEQIPDPQLAVDFVLPGDEVVLADGTYEVASDRGFQTGLFVETPDITLRAARGATPEVVHAEDLPAPRAIAVDADGVTVDGVDANVLDGRVDPKNDIGTGVLVREGTSDVTVRNLTAGGTFGVQLESTTGLTVENVTAVDSVTGVGTDSSFFGEVTDATITGVTVRDSPSFSFSGGVVIEDGASEVTVTDCDVVIEDGDVGGIVLVGPFDGGSDCRVADNTVRGPGTDEEPFGVGNAGVVTDQVEATVENNTVTDTYFGVQVGGRLGFGEQDVTVVGNDLDVTGVGYAQTGDYATVERNVVDAAVGFDFGDGGFFGLEGDQVLARFNDLSATDLPFTGVAAESLFDPVPTAFDCRQNYLGDRSYGEPVAEGDPVYNPFLRVPPAEADLPEPTRIAVDLTLDPDTTYALGVPGPTDKTVYEVLGTDGFTDFDGELEFWNPNSERWQRVTGRGTLAEIDTLDVFRVTPTTGVRAVVDFRREDGAPGRGGKPPGLRDKTPGQREVTPGTDYVAAPVFGDAGEVFGDGVTVEAPLAGPDGQIGDADRDAFTGYEVSVDRPTTVEASLDDYEPTLTELYEGVGLDPAIHESPGTAPSSFATGLTVADVVEAAPDEETATDGAATLVGKKTVAAVEDPDDDQAVIDAVESTAETAAANTPDDETAVVEAATRRAVRALLRRSFDASVLAEDETTDYATETAERAADAGTDRASLTPTFDRR